MRDWYFGTAPETALATPEDGDKTRPGGMYLSTKSREKYNDFQTVIQQVAQTVEGRTADDPISRDTYDQLQKRVSALRAEITEDLLSRRRVFLTR
ncbi:MAG TPA: hypothetical protein VFR14_11180 [Candidatus Limnocylindrales bacterium]|nr:hypothetical protein [Candidatus Limnocylindrales bacterium]